MTYYYIKNIKELTYLIKKYEAKDFEVIIEGKRGSAFLSLNLDNIKGNVLVISSLSTLGKNKIEIKRELERLASNNIKLIVGDLDIQDKNLLDEDIIKVLIYAIDYKPNNNVIEFNNPVGRKKIEYPSGWEENYILWKDDEITAREFQKRVGLKKGTFYNLVADYEVMLKQNENIKKNESIKEIKNESKSKYIYRR